MATSSISDGWEELSESQSLWNDDNYSVRSVPTSDDAVSLSHDDVPLQDGPAGGGNVITLPFRQQIPDTVENSPDIEQEYAKDDDARSTASDRTTIFDLTDIDVDPALLVSTISSVMVTLTETATAVASLHDTIECSTTEDIGKECDSLHSQLSDLNDIASTYAKSTNPASPYGRAPPLDPALYKWVTDLLVLLLGLQAEINDIAKRIATDPSDMDVMSLSLESYYDSIKQFRTEMDDFLPIIAVDLYEFQTGDLSFPLDVPEASHVAENRMLQPPSHDPKWQLRRDLYDLKDSIQTWIQRLDICRSGIVSNILPLVDSLRAEQDLALKTLSLILTNNPSDWIENGLNGGLTYAEFCLLNSSEIRHYTCEARSMCMQLGTANTLPDHVKVDNKDEFAIRINLTTQQVENMKIFVKGLNQLIKAQRIYETNA